MRSSPERRSPRRACDAARWRICFSRPSFTSIVRGVRSSRLASEEEQEAVALEAVADAPEPIELQESTVRAALDRLPIRSAPFCTFTVSKR